MKTKPPHTYPHKYINAKETKQYAPTQQQVILVWSIMWLNGLCKTETETIERNEKINLVKTPSY